MTEEPRIVVEVRSGRNAFEVGLLSFSFLAGLLGLVVPGGQGTSATQFPHPWVWYLNLMVWAGVTLAALKIRNPVDRSLLERVGLFGLTLTSPAYAVAAIMANGTHGVTAAIFIGCALCGAAIYRLWEIRQDLPKLREVAAAQEAFHRRGSTDPPWGD